MADKAQEQPKNEEPKVEETKAEEESGSKGEETPNDVPYSRFKEKNDEVKKLRAWKEQKEREEAEKREQELKAKEEYKTLLEEKEKKLEELETRTTIESKKRVVEKLALQKGTIDVDVVTNLINLDDIPMKDGEVDTEGAEIVINTLKENKAYLFEGAKPKTIGNKGGNPEEGASKRTFKRSELRDPEFFAQHEKEIMDAMKNNRIIND